MLPIVGVVTGLPAAAVMLSAYALPPGVVASLALGVALLLAGLHHTDGVLDVGDALMVRGDPARRRSVLKDARVGVGGIGGLFLVYAPAFAALSALAVDSPWRAALAVIAAEVSARCAVLFMLAFGKPAEEGSSSAPFVRALAGKRGTVAVAFALLAPLPFLLPLGPFALMSALSAPLTALAGLGISRRAFDGISGDAAGATGELARTVMLVILSASA